VTIVRIVKHLRQKLWIYAFAVFGAGVGIGRVHPLPDLRFLIPLALLMMLFPAFLDVDKEKLRYVTARPLPFFAALVFNIALAPPLMYVLTGWLGDEATGLTVGLLIFGMIPAGGMGPAYTGMLRGNVNLAVAVSAVSLLLTLVTVPFWSRLLIGRVVAVPVALIAGYLVMIIVLPLLLAVLTRRFVTRRRGEAVFIRLKDALCNYSAIGLLVLLFIIPVINGKLLADSLAFLAEMLPPAAAFSMFLLVAANAIGMALQLPYGDRVALTVGATTKNTAIAMALATAVFSGREALAIAVAGPLVQLPVMLGYINILTRTSAWKKAEAADPRP